MTTYKDVIITINQRDIHYILTMLRHEIRRGEKAVEQGNADDAVKHRLEEGKRIKSFLRTFRSRK